MRHIQIQALMICCRIVLDAPQRLAILCTCPAHFLVAVTALGTVFEANIKRRTCGLQAPTAWRAHVHHTCPGGGGAAIRTLQGSRSMPSSKGGSRGSPGVRAAQGGRKAAFGRASAKAPGRSSACRA